MNNMLNDNREIKEIWWEPDGAIQVGRNNITKIRCYGEPGQGAYIPWFEIWKEDKLINRINGALICGVTYF